MNQAAANRTILYAEDEAIIRFSLATRLRMDGWTVIEASSGEEALELAAARPPDILLLDNRLPGLTGVEVHQILRERSFTIPAVLLTATVDPRNLIRSAGIAHVLSKPFDYPELRALLAELLP